jgi:hypothetical protein
MVLAEGKFHVSFCGNGKSGYQLKPASDEMRFACTCPMAEPVCRVVGCRLSSEEETR